MRPSTVFLILAAAVLFYAQPAEAYIGPGAGITLLSAIWGVIVAFFLAIGAVLLWPFRLLMRRRRNRAAKAASEQAAQSRDTPQ